MRNFSKLGEVETLSALASIKEEHWHADTYLRDYPQGPFNECDSVILRFPPRSVLETEAAMAEHRMHFDQHECVWLPVSADLPLIRELVFNLSRVVCSTRLGRVMINRMQPGGRIFKHADTPDHAAYWSRFHICLHALPGVRFHCGDELINMTTNEIWYFDNREEHEVINETTDPRIHLVIDMKTELR